MGIPFYFSRITKEHPEIVRSGLECIVDYLFLDFNCGIHYCNKLLRDELSGRSVDDEEYESLLIDKCINYIHEITEGKIIRNLFISIDGVVPFSKMAQQRKRRYLSVFRNEHINSSVHIWDSNAISPGTSFMAKLNSRLDESRFKQILSNTIISDSTEPGEGETKIFNFIKEQDIEGSSLVIYGLDADLIMLSMLIEKENSLFLMREAEFYRYGMDSKYLFLDITLLKSKLIDHIFSLTHTQSFGNPIQNYVVICMLIGNDFIPSLSYLKIANNSIDLLLLTLARCCEENEGIGDLIYFDNGAWQVNFITLQLLLTKLSTTEDTEYCKVHSKYYNTRKECKTDLEKIEHYGVFNKAPDVICPNRDGWRRRYYSSLFSSATLDDICKNYIVGLKWNVDYYLNNRCFTKWHYPYDYSPTIFDLNNYLTVTNTNELKVPSCQNYVSDEEHLAMILPKQSHHLLNKSMRSKLSQLKYAKLYPVKYGIQTYLKHYLHDCVPMIPGLTVISSSEINLGAFG